MNNLKKKELIQKNIKTYNKQPLITNKFFTKIEPLFFNKNISIRNSEKTEKAKEKKIDIYQQLGRITYRKHIENVLSRIFSINVNLHPIKTYQHYRSALFLAEDIVYYLERRIPFRRIKYNILRDVKRLPSIKGIRIQCSGRVGGRSKKAQRAKTETVKYGQTSLHVFSSNIDFASKKALTPFGLVGIKVWVCYRDFDKELFTTSPSKV